MPYNFDQLKIPVFENINDKPVEPTSSKAGNGADLINRFNNLVDEMEAALNSLPSTMPIYDWTVTLPNIDTIQIIDVYYLNISETKLYDSDSVHYLTEPDKFLKRFVAEYDFSFNQGINILNISSLVIDNGCGYYFFVATADNQFLRYLTVNTNSISPRGGARLADRPIDFIVNDSQGMNTNLSMRPLVVIQPASSVSLTLSDNPPS